MRLPTTLLAIETDLRRTVSQGEFRRSPELLQRYMDELEREAHCVAPGSPEARNLRVRATALLDWIGTMAYVARAHYASELERLPRLTPFGNPQPHDPQTTIDA